MATRVTIPEHFCTLVYSIGKNNPIAKIAGPAKQWLKENQIDETTGYTLVFHNGGHHLDFANINDAIRFRLVMTEWLKAPVPIDTAMFYVPYIPLQFSHTSATNSPNPIKLRTRYFKETDINDESTS